MEVRHRAFVVVAVTVTTIVACGSVPERNQGLTPPGGNSDGGSSSGTPPVEGPHCSTTIFVSRTGDDLRGGCDSATPFRTIAAAIARAKADHTTEVHVCGGTFDEPALLIDAPVTLRGGYDCTNWTRPSELGYPSFPASASTTTLKRTTPSMEASTLQVDGPLVTRAVVIEGLTIEGPPLGSTAGVALRVSGGASPTIRDVLARGGAGRATMSSPGSAGIEIAGGSTPELTRTRVFGGAGVVDDPTLSVIATVGVFIRASSPLIHDIKVDASSGPASAAGILIVDGAKVTGPNALAKVQIGWTAAKRLVAGVLVQGAEADIVDSTVEHGRLDCDRPICQTFGVGFLAAAKGSVMRSRLSAGEIMNSAPGATTNAVYVNASSPVVVANNMIHTGNLDKRELGAFGVSTQGSTDLRVLYNTIVGGPASSTSALNLQEDSKNTVVEGNILATAGPGFGVVLNACGGASLAKLAGNAFVGMTKLMTISRAGTPCTSVDVSQIAGLATEVAGASANLHVAAPAACAEVAPNTCLAPGSCTTADGCLGAMFVGWADPPTKKMLESGWKLSPTGTCMLARPSGLPHDVMDDHYGTKRTMFSYGAHESTDCVSP